MFGKPAFKIALLVTLVMVLSAAVQAGPLEKRSRIELWAGGWVESGDAKVQTGIDGAMTSVSSGVPCGGVGFSHWLSEDWSLYFTASALSIDVDTRIDFLGVTSTTSIISSYMVGARRYITMQNPRSTVRPYLDGGVGIFSGSQEKSDIGITVIHESTTETTFGARLGGGCDLLLGKRFTLGAGALYNIMADFKNPVGNRDNYNGIIFSLVFGVLFG